MADKIIKTIKFLPEFLQTGKNSKFLSSTIDQLIQKPQLERLDGFVGSTRTPNYRSSDVYITESTDLRSNYQLDPSLIIKDGDSNIKDVVDINDLVNEINIRGGSAENFDSLFRTEFYSYEPHIDNDKFINYQNYYWLINGPTVIDVSPDFSQSTIVEDINVPADILGRDSYLIPNLQVPLANGMKIRFAAGGVTPTSYENKIYWVEGVGTAIKLIEDTQLLVSEKIATIYDDSFDQSLFDEYPFDSYKRLPLTPDYITINRASVDLNPWTRYNRWVHKDVIQVSAEVNDVQPDYPVNLRALRPIIEFKPNIKLYNFGTVGIPAIDLVDTKTTDAFSLVEGSAGHHADGVLLQQGHRIIFTADTDLSVRGKIYEVNFINIDNNIRLTLVEVYSPSVGDTTYVNLGNIYGGTSWWYTGTEWKSAQQHDKLNQPPLFDLFDQNGNSYSDQEFYKSDFKGNRIFGYEDGNGPADPVLGFSLKYRNSIGVGSYVFRNYLTADSITVSEGTDNSITISTSRAFLKIDNSYYNAWKEGVEYPIPLVTSQINTSSFYYDLPLGLTNNPLNGLISSITLSDFRNHVSTSTQSRLISNVNPMPFALMFLGKKEHNVIDALTKAADQYNLFKIAFIKKITELSIEDDPARAVDEALKSLNSTKTESSPYYLSDMVAYGDDYTLKNYVVNNVSVTSYPIGDQFNLDEIGFRSVLVYLNGNLLIHGTDYTFDQNDSYVNFTVTLNIGDQISIRDYQNTKGSYVPSTPSKLGLFPKYQPRIFLDDSYLNATQVIEGHDGSMVVAFGDYRDNIILELEKRIYNNIKAKYRSEILDFHEVVPGAFRNTGYSIDDINRIIQQDFIRWTTNYGIDPTINSGYDVNDSYTWNYTGSYIQELNLSVNGSWRAMLHYLYDTDRPDLNPWEMLGFTEQPDWWVQIYGVAPYGTTNTLLWQDLEEGRIRQGEREGVDPLYARPGLSQVLPVDAAGVLEDPDEHVINILIANTRLPWKFNDWGAAETAWRRSSYWPFVVQKLLALTKPATYSSMLYDPARLRKNAANQWVYGDGGEFLNLRNMPVQGLNDYPTSGYSVYVAEAGRQRTANYNNELKEDLENLDINLFYKVGGFIDKSQLQISIDAFDPLSTAPGAVLQQEDYTLILNSSNPIRQISISGIIVQKSEGKFLIKGLDLQNPYFTVYIPNRNSNTRTITVGGISAPFLVWAPSMSAGSTGLTPADTTSAVSASVGTYYEKGTYVKYNNNFYIVLVNHRSGARFEPNYFQQIPSLPITGGATVQVAVGFDKTTEVLIPYGTVYDNIQQVYDLIVGYGEWLKDQGFIFNQYNSDLQSTLDWEFTAKEFLYWTTQNWADSSVIALSPFSDVLSIKLNDSVIDNIFNSFYEYSILEASGQALPQRYLNVVRDEGLCEIKVTTENRGIYFARLYSVQKEHAIVFNNRTIFNDSIYDIETGYRQARVKLLGFRTANWNGDYFSPGFVYDTAVISDWKQFKDYKFEDVVRFNSNYYVAKKNLPGSEAFNFDDWRLLGKKPVAALIPNFDYKISQFEDFYSLDTNNFDEGQQQAAQHLIGYTPRVYLNNIFSDPVAQYKFYQGFIKEKGTRNSIVKLQRASVQNLNGKLDYNEEWAFRMGYYGSYSSYREIELPLQEGTFVDNPQIIEFTDAANTNTSLKVYASRSDLTIKPRDYVTTQTFVTTHDNYEDVFKVTNAGYARFDDVDFIAFNESSILAFTTTNVIEEGQTVWLANTKLNDWTVLRKTLSVSKLIRVEVDTSAENRYLFTTDRPHGFNPEKIITIEEFDSAINGIYKVNSVVDRDTFTIISTTTNILDTIQPDNPGLIFSFENTRYNSFDNLPADSELLALPRNSKVWIDTDNNGGWKVYQKIKNYKNFSITASTNPINQDLGYSISKQKDTSIFMVGNPGYNQAGFNKGNVFVYQRYSNYSTLIGRYGINDNSVESYYDKDLDTGFGIGLFYDKDEFIDVKGPTGYGLLFAGAPLASKVNIPSTSTLVGSLVEQGLVKISSINRETTVENTVEVVKSPNPASDERYGASIFVATKNNNKVLLIGAPFTPTSGTGTVYRYVLTTSTVNTGTVNLTNTSSISLNYSTINRIEIVNSGTNYRVGDVITITSPLASAPILARITRVNDAGSVRSFAAPIDNSIIFNVPPGSTISSPSFTATNTGTGLAINLIANTEIGSQWGICVAGSEQDSFVRDRGVIAIGAPGFALGKGFVAVYTGTNTSFFQYIISPFENNSNFGANIAVSASGNYLFVAAPNSRSSDQSYGKVAVYRRNSVNQSFTLTQIISNPVPGVGMKFGQSLDINTNEEELVISAIGTNRRVNVTFDDYTDPLVTNPDFRYDNDPNSEYTLRDTSYDIDSTYFIDRIAYSGSVYVYNRKNNLFKIADELSPVNINSGTNYGYSLSIIDNNIFVGAPALINENDTTINAELYQFYKKDTNATSWKLLRNQTDLVKTDAIQKVALIDVLKDEVVDYLEVVDPLKGKIIGIAEQELSYKLSYDPAVYSVGNSNVIVDLNNHWLDEHVGELWWDLSAVKYPWYEQGESEYRKNYWGTVFPGSSIDVYEWVKTELLPTQWAALANTREGLSIGVSGQPKYLDNTNLSVRQIYNPISGTFSNYYYYWVKNTLDVPASKNRRISAYQVARLIEDPKVQGERFVEILSENSLAIANSSNLLIDNRIHLNIVSDEINNSIPRHTEWLILQEGSAKSMPPASLEKKFLDSLKGTDALGNLVPDPELSARERYGIEIRPRQSMFKDRNAALRNVIEFVNSVLINQRTTGIYSFENLNKQESPPDINTNEYDQVVEDNLDLELIDTDGLETAEMSCLVSNGKIVSVSITSAGYGYKVAPTVEIENNLYGAKIVTEIDVVGQVVSATVVNGGKMFVDSPKLTVRPYTVLVLADETYNGKWTKFIYDTADVIIWRQDRGYLYGQKVKYNNNFYSAKYDIAINSAFDPADWNMLPLAQAEGKWVRARTQLYNTPLYWSYIDWTSENYNRYKDYAYIIEAVFDLNKISPAVGEYIKIKDNGLGYYIILEKISDNQIGTFSLGYNIVYSEKGTIQISNNIWDTQNSNLGFDKNTYDQTLFGQTPDLELKYILDALKENIFVGDLKVYWNLMFFVAVRYAMSEQKFLDWAFKTSFINVTNYAGELRQLPVYKLANAEFYEDYLLEAKPYHTQIRSFTTNHSLFDVSNSYVTDFDLPPVYDAEQNKIIVVNSGSEYLSQYPWKSWADNYGSTTTIRSNLITLRYDRISKDQEITDLSVVDTFVGNGSKAEFTLTWLAQPDSSTIKVFLENNKVLDTDYQIVYYKENYNGYQKRFSKLVFTAFIPSVGQKVTIDCKKNTELLTAVDRTLNFYSPTEEMPGKELAQLMTGIEYPQTTLEVLSLNYSTRWGDTEVGYDNASYEDELSFYTYTTTTSVSGSFAGTLTIFQVYDLTGIEVGQTVNVISSTSTFFITTGTYDEPKVYSIITASNYVYVDKPVTSPIPANSKIEFWSYNENPSILDTQYIGGDFSYVISTATGAIEIDGDAFLTPDASYGPEELIPGDFYESVGINVYTKAPVQSPIIIASYIDILETYTTTTRVLSIVPPSPAAVIVSYNNSVATATVTELATELTSTIYLSTLDGFKLNNPLAKSPGIQENTQIIGFTGTNGIVISRPLIADISTGTIIQAVKFNVPTVFEYVEYNSTGTTFTSANQFSIDWTNDNGRHPILLIAPQPLIGKLAYTVIDIGGSSTGNQTGFVDSKSVVVDDVTEVELESLGIYGSTVKSAYVTVNGVSIPRSVYMATTATAFALDYANELNKRAAAKVFNLPAGTNVVSAWFFGTEQKLWNEIREEIKSVPRFTNTFTAFATLNSYTITNVSSLIGIVAGSTNIYARNPQGGFYLDWATTVDSIIGGDTIVMGDPIAELPGGALTATIEFTIESSPPWPIFPFPSYKEITSTGTWNSTFAFPPGNIEPQIANAIVEFKNYQSQTQRMLIPPKIDYYSVDDVNNNTFAITNKTPSGAMNPLNPDMSEIRAYLNGTELRRGFDYVFNVSGNIIKIDASLLSVGDVVAILSKPGSTSVNGIQDYEYDVYNDNLILCASRSAQQTDPSIGSYNATSAGWNVDWYGEIKIITYTNHDHLLMRTEVFDGVPSGRFKISRPVLDESYVWVSLNGIPLANYRDFEILDDGMTVQITDSYTLTSRDIITIVSFASNKTTADIIGFRLFNDLFNRQHYKRLSKQNSTYLTQPLTDMDSMVYVKDSSVLTKPIIDKNVPGVVLINGERIEFFKTYSVAGSIEIINPGVGFVSNDTITFSGTNWIVPLTATVTANGIGGIISLTLSGGVYDGIAIASPSSFSSTSGNGSSTTFKINLIPNSVLAQLRRGTLGTSPKVYSQPYTEVIDQGTVQSIPYSDRILKQNILTTASQNTYVISTASFNYKFNTDTLSTSTWMNDGITLTSLVMPRDFPLTSVVLDPVNQIDVYYGGRKLNKGYTFHQDGEIAYDNQEIRKLLGVTQVNTTATVNGLPAQTITVGTAYVITTTNQVWVYENSLAENAVSGYVYKGLTRQDPEFTLNTSTQEITLNIPGGVKEGVRLTIVKKEFSASSLWNNNGVSLLDSNSNQAKFLRARPAQLPDDQYYGGDFELTDNTGAALTDDQGNPLIGLN